MIYETAITIPANTSRTNPQRTDIKLTAGILSRLNVQFPPGCVGLAHISIWWQSHQLYPTNPDADISADDYTVDFEVYFPLDTAPYVLSVRGYNEDDTYDHTITVRFGVLPDEAYWRTGPNSQLDRKVAAAFGIQS